MRCTLCTRCISIAPPSTAMCACVPGAALRRRAVVVPYHRRVGRHAHRAPRAHRGLPRRDQHGATARHQSARASLMFGGTATCARRQTGPDRGLLTCALQRMATRGSKPADDTVAKRPAPAVINSRGSCTGVPQRSARRDPPSPARAFIDFHPQTWSATTARAERCSRCACLLPLPRSGGRPSCLQPLCPPPWLR